MPIVETDIKDYRYRPMPTPPDEVIRYCKEKLKDPRHKMVDEFWRKVQIMGWFKQHSQWLADMRSNHDWLEHLVAKDNDPVAGEMLKTYQDKMEEWWAFGFDLVRELASHNITYGGNRALEEEMP